VAAAMRGSVRSAVLLALLASADVAVAQSVAGRITQEGAPVADAVVYLEGANAAPVATPPARATMDQRDLRFVPPLLVIARGTTVDFTNSDDIQHNVFSPSSVARKFDLGTYGPGAVRSITFDQAGEAVILCNIHMEMEARILVLEQPYFAKTSADGRYRIDDVRPGQYTLKVWREKPLAISRSAAVGAGVTTVDLALPD